MARNRIHNFHDRLKAKVAESMLPYDLGDMLIGALEKELSEVLDDPQFNDLSRDDKDRMREVM